MITMRKTAIGGAIALALALALAPASVLAQDDMADDDMMMGSMVPHPSHIHVGICPAPGDVVAPLSDVTVVGNDAQGAGSHIHVDVSTTTVGVALPDILAADHSIVVHQSADDMGTYIACGDIGGHFVDDSFVIGIGPVADSGFSGIAWLTDNGDGTTDVSVTVTQSGATVSDDMDDDDMDDE
jgi:hypothetical protein